MSDRKLDSRCRRNALNTCGVRNKYTIFVHTYNNNNKLHNCRRIFTLPSREYVSFATNCALKKTHQLCNTYLLLFANRVLSCSLNNHTLTSMTLSNSNIIPLIFLWFSPFYFSHGYAYKYVQYYLMYTRQYQTSDVKALCSFFDTIHVTPPMSAVEHTE